MAGGLLQLVAYGSQDLYLTGNPQITFFKIVYRRHTNFAIESRKLTFTGDPNFGRTSQGCNILKGPDLLYKLYLDLKISTGKIDNSAITSFTAFRWLNWLGHILVKHVRFNIGGSEIDKHTGEWLHIWNELSQKEEKKAAYSEMVGNVPLYTHIATTNSNESEIDLYKGLNLEGDSDGPGAINLHIPLLFWFCKNPGLALPLVALTNPDITLEFEFRNLHECIWATQETSTHFINKKLDDVFKVKPKFEDCHVYADYIYLDIEERNRFANSTHEYLIEKLQIGQIKQSKDSEIINYSLDVFTQPIKELIWVIQPSKYFDQSFTQSRAGNQYFNYTSQWDYSGFTGTPEFYTGNGMIGGRASQNINNGFPNINLPYIDGEIEPDLSETLATSVASSSWWNEANTMTPDISKNDIFSGKKKKLSLGYNRVKMYHPVSLMDTNNGTSDIINKKGANRYLGNTSGLQNAEYFVTDVDDNRHIAQYYGSTSNTEKSKLKYLDKGLNPTSSAKITLNGTNRIEERNGFYFNTVQPYQHHTNCPAPGINVYSFSFDPEEHQPSGSCNFSRISNGSIEVTLTKDLNTGIQVKMQVYAVQYNILRIANGSGQLGYSS